MGLSKNSTGIGVLSGEKGKVSDDYKYKIGLAGNPNVGKSTVFNALTGLNQHTGNWPGKTVAKAEGYYEFKDSTIKIVDLPGTYSLLSNSEEEEIARDYICFNDPDIVVVVADATSLERNLNLFIQISEITEKAILCVNLIDEAEKMNKLVMDMLELSKLEAGKIDLHIIDFSLTELTEEVLVKNSVDINKNNLTVIKNYSPNEDLYVQGDDFKIEQVLTNFVTNAIKYSEPNNQIIIDIKPVEEDKIHFSIENTGAHIPDSDINKIWTQFYRGDTSRNRGSRSTGLGLSIVKNLLQAHESEFGVMNTENGVKFYFTLKKSKEIDEVEEI